MLVFMYKSDLGINIYYEEVCDIFGNLHRFLPTHTNKKFFRRIKIRSSQVSQQKTFVSNKAMRSIHINQ